MKAFLVPCYNFVAFSVFLTYLVLPLLVPSQDIVEALENRPVPILLGPIPVPVLRTRHSIPEAVPVPLSTPRVKGHTTPPAESTGTSGDMNTQRRKKRRSQRKVMRSKFTVERAGKRDPDAIMPSGRDMTVPLLPPRRKRSQNVPTAIAVGAGLLSSLLKK